MTAPVGNVVTSPAATTLDSYDDAMSALYTTLSNARQNDVAAGESQVEQDQVQRQQDETRQRAALEREKANQANSGGGFFADIGHFFGDVASDLVHGRFGSAIDDAGRDLDVAWNDPKFWNDVKTGLEDVALVAAAVTATVTTAGVGTMAVAAVAAGTGAIAEGGAGLAGMRVAHFAASAQDASADATAAGDDIARMQQLTTDALADLKQSDESHQRALASVTQSIQTNDETLVAASSTTVKG
jgi:hypothetical protein